MTHHISELLEQVHHMALEIAGTVDSQRVLRAALQNFSRMGNLTNAWIALDQGGESFIVAASLDKKNQLPQGSYSEIVKAVLRMGQAVLASPQAQTLENFEQPAPLLCLPLIYRSNVLGVILLESDPNVYLFGKPEVKVLSLLANHTAIAFSHAQLFEAATQDGMTKLGIHRYFQIRLQQEIDRALRHKLPLSLLFLDVDFFKKFNDTYGHQVGDTVLIHVAGILKSHTRGSDVCARYGGEEFAVVLPEARLNDAVAVAERMRKKIEQTPILVQGKECAVTVSIGVSDLKHDDSITSAQLIERADQTLYQAKRKGRNCVLAWQEAEIQKDS